MTDTVSTALPPAARTRLHADLERFARTMVVAVAVGMTVTGVVARLAMFLLAQLNPSTAGMTSDDGFTIHQFTLAGSLNLLVVGAALGALSGVLWTVLAPLKTGPRWFQRLSFSVGAGTVVGSQIVHSDGIDFVFLDRPAFVAVAMFVLIPILHVLALDLLASSVESEHRLRSRAWTAVGVLLALPTAPLMALVVLARWTWFTVPEASGLGALLRAPAWPWAFRAALSVVFVIAATSIGHDVARLA